MISKQQAKFVKSLKLKKYRNKAASFLVEGAKNIVELISSDYEIQHLYVTEKFLNQYSEHLVGKLNYELCIEKDLIALGTFQSNEYGLAVAKMKVHELDMSRTTFAIALDNVSDPGNLGTIIRIADWYGIKTILANNESADFYNPKVINASMGSFVRVNIIRVDLGQFLSENKTHPVYGAMLEGEKIHAVNYEMDSILLMGNESVGISPSLLKFIDTKITIPRIGNAESLNVAVSTGIICDSIFKNQKMDKSSPASSAIRSATS